MRQPAPTVHRLLGVLKRRGFVRQDEDTARYSLTLKMLDLSFRVLGRSELRLHAYPVLREYVLRTGLRAFIAVPGSGEVTYLWTGGPDEVGMHTTYGREMPVHCAMYVDASAKRRLSCFKLEQPRDAAEHRSDCRALRRPGAAADSAPAVHLRAGVRLHRPAGRARRRVRRTPPTKRHSSHDQTSAAMELARSHLAAPRTSARGVGRVRSGGLAIKPAEAGAAKPARERRKGVRGPPRSNEEQRRGLYHL